MHSVSRHVLGTIKRQNDATDAERNEKPYVPTKLAQLDIRSLAIPGRRVDGLYTTHVE